MISPDTRFDILPSPATGQGLFARSPIKKKDFIIEYIGERITTAEADAHPGRYLFEIDKDWTINGDTDTNTAKYINHSCDPNTEAEIEDSHINIYAIKNIATGEELTIDYGQEYFDEFIKPVGCRCSARKHHT